MSAPETAKERVTRRPAGRPPMPNSSRVQIESLAALGLTPVQIRKRTGFNLAYIHQIASHVTHAARRDESMPYAEDDRNHYEACLREGGFPTAYHLDGKTYLQNVWGRPWAHRSLDGSYGGRAA